MNRAFKHVLKATKPEFTGRVAVVYYYDQKPVQGKQEVRLAVRKMTKKQRLAMLSYGALLILEEISDLL